MAVQLYPQLTALPLPSGLVKYPRADGPVSGVVETLLPSPLTTVGHEAACAVSLVDGKS